MLGSSNMFGNRRAYYYDGAWDFETIKKAVSDNLIDETTASGVYFIRLADYIYVGCLTDLAIPDLHLIS